MLYDGVLATWSDCCADIWPMQRPVPSRLSFERPLTIAGWVILPISLVLILLMVQPVSHSFPSMRVNMITVEMMMNMMMAVVLVMVVVMMMAV